MNRKIGVILSYVLMIFEVLSTLLLTPFIIRTLGQAEYGVYKLSAAITAYLLLLDLGVGNAIIRYIAKFKEENDKEKESQFLGVAILFYVSVALVSLVIGCILVAVFPTVFANGLTPAETALGQKLLFVTVLTSSVTLGTACFNNVILAYERFAVSRISSIIQIIIRMLATVLVLRLGFGSLGIVCIQLALTVLLRGFMALYVLCHMKIRPRFKHIEFSFVKEIVTYSSLVFLQMIATQLNATVDQLLLGSLVASSAALIGIYGVGAQVVQYYQSIGSAFNGVLMPGIVRMVEQKASPKEITDEMVKVGRIILMVLAPIFIGFLVCGKDFIILWAGEANQEAYKVASILMFAYMFILTEAVGSQILWAYNQHKEQAYMKIGIVLANIVLTVFLIKWNPLLGATIGTFISLMLGDVVAMNIIFKKKLKMKIGYYYRHLLKGILPGALLMLAVGILLHFFIPGTVVGFLIKLCVMLGVYGLAMLGFGMNTYEKNLIFSILKINGKKHRRN